MQRGKGLTAMMLTLAACTPVLVVSLDVADPHHTMENIALLSSQETWLRQIGWHDIPADAKAFWMPTRNGEPRIVKPPMLVWLHMLAWSDLTPAGSNTTQLTHRARLVAAGLGLVMLGSIFWCGRTLGDLRLAVLATLIAGSTWFFQRQARSASYDIHLAAWATLAVASGLWAIAPGQAMPAAGRRVVGWLVCCLALIMAWLSKGPLSLVLVLLPLTAALCLERRHWRPHVIGMVGAVVVAAAVVLPWFRYAWAVAEEAAATWRHEFLAPRPEFQPPYYYLGLLGLMLPWTIWLIAGLFHPWMRGEPGARQRLMVAWLWFVLLFVFFSIPPAKQQRYILPIVPAAALLAARVFADHAALAKAGRPDPGARLLQWPHWMCLLAASLMLPLLIAAQPILIGRGWLGEPFSASMPWPAAAAWSAGLIAIAALGAWRHLGRHDAWHGGLATAAWALLLTTVWWPMYVRGPHRVHPIRAEAQRVVEVVGDAPLRHLRLSRQTEGLNEEFLFFARRIAPEVTPQQLETFASQSRRPFFVLADADSAEEQWLREHGYEPVLDYHHDKNAPQRVWRRNAAR